MLSGTSDPKIAISAKLCSTSSMSSSTMKYSSKKYVLPPVVKLGTVNSLQSSVKSAPFKDSEAISTK